MDNVRITLTMTGSEALAAKLAMETILEADHRDGECAVKYDNHNEVMYELSKLSRGLTASLIPEEKEE